MFHSMRPLYERIKAHLPLVEQELIKQGDAATHCYRDDGSFSFALFEAFLAREGLEWDRTDSGRPRLDTDYIKRRVVGCPKLRDFYELKGALNLLRGLDKARAPELSDGSIRRSKILAPSADGYIRCSLWAFGSATGRNQPQAQPICLRAGDLDARPHQGRRRATASPTSTGASRSSPWPADCQAMAT